MWAWRNMENINCKDHMTNEFVLDLVKEKGKLLCIVLQRKKRIIGQSLLKDVIEGQMEVKKEEKFHVSCT